MSLNRNYKHISITGNEKDGMGNGDPWIIHSKIYGDEYGKVIIRKSDPSYYPDGIYFKPSSDAYGDVEETIDYEMEEILDFIRQVGKLYKITLDKAD